MDTTTRLQGRVAIVTGASKGIGRGIAERLARDGATVIVNHRDSEGDAADVVRVITDAGGRARAIRADASKPAEIAGLFERTLEEVGRPHVLVANAGQGHMQPIAEANEEDFDRFFALNAKSVLFGMKEAARHLHDGGRVVVISSTTTLHPVPGTAIYAGSKAALKLFMQVGALELGARRITVNSVLPGVTETPMSSGLPQAFKDAVIARTPLGRLGVPADIAGVVAFLASEEGGWINGQEIIANGGGMD